MSTRIATIVQIRDEFHHEGRVAAIQRARSAFDAGLIDALDVPEIFMALKTGSWRFLEQWGVATDSSGGPMRSATG